MPDDPDAALIERMVAANYGGTSEQALAGIGPFAMDGERDACRRVLAVVREHDARRVAEAPGMTDLMVSPESLDAFMEANPLPEDPIATAEARGYRAGIEDALTTKIQLVEATAGPEPTLERMIRVYYTARIDDWGLANQYADELLAAIRALADKPRKE